MHHIESLRISFPAGATGGSVAVYPPGSNFGPRTMRDFEFVWIIQGDVTWQCDGVDHAAPAGSILLARPGMRDGFRWDPLHETRHGFYHFTIDLAGAELPAMEEWPLVRRLPENDIIRQLFCHVDWLMRSRPDHWLVLAEHAMRHALLAFITGAMAVTGDVGPPLHPLIEQVVAHVQRRWAKGRLEQISLDELAEAAGVSRAHLARIFRAHLGATPVESMRILRLDRAAALLVRTNLAINVIAEQTGFENAFHFSRVFRQQYGHSPRAMRLRIAAGENMPTIPLVRVRHLSARMWQKPPG
ncbi:MAG: helix-turn-helix transcriptional regulator [Planctomycetes bacterium]|nr:helix-turn-helix transcriptional regulator [Planctomycetota bacterium]